MIPRILTMISSEGEQGSVVMKFTQIQFTHCLDLPKSFPCLCEPLDGDIPQLAPYLPGESGAWMCMAEA